VAEVLALDDELDAAVAEGLEEEERADAQPPPLRDGKAGMRSVGRGAGARAPPGAPAPRARVAGRLARGGARRGGVWGRRETWPKAA
jgi:hypothetical protein